jgi:hypothetical protein
MVTFFDDFSRIFPRVSDFWLGPYPAGFEGSTKLPRAGESILLGIYDWTFPRVGRESNKDIILRRVNQ